MNYLTGTINWSPEYVGDDVDGWIVLGSVGDPSAEPACLANVARDVRTAEVSLYEGTWYVRVVPKFKAGGYGDWTKVTPEEIQVTAREDAPPTPTAAAVAFVDSTSTARVADEPPTQADAQPYYQEVIVGPDADRGQVVAEHGVEPAGPLMPDGQRTASPAFALESLGAGDTLDVLVRNIGGGGRPGTAVAKTIATPPDAATKFHELPIVVVSGATHTGLAAPTSTQGWEFDATDGLRLLAFPAVSGMTADWTTILNANEYLSDYVDNAFVESNEIDLGAVMTFRLSSSQTVQRKTATGSFATRSGAMYMDPVDPLSNPLAVRGVLSPLWVGREVGSDGKARRPIRPQDCQVKYIVSTGSGFAHARADYQPMVDGAWLRGRYVRVAIFLREPYGGYQLICPRWTVSAHVMRGTTVGAGTPEAAVVGVPGAHFFRTDGPPHHYVKATGIGNTGWLASNAGGSGGSTPTGTGFRHVTAGAEDAATKLVDTADINAGQVTLAKLADLATDRLIGRDTAGTGVPEALTVGGGIEFTGSGGIQRSALTGDVTASAGSGATTVGKITETSGPTSLVVGSIANGEYVKRVGATLVGGTPSGSGGPVAGVLRKTADYSAASGDSGKLVICNPGAANMTITLPLAPADGYTLGISAVDTSTYRIYVATTAPEVFFGNQNGTSSLYTTLTGETIWFAYDSVRAVWEQLYGTNRIAAGSNYGLTVLAAGGTVGAALAADDSTVTNARAPTGSASGSLTGSYPNPTLATASVSEAQLADAAWTAIYMGA